MFIHNIAFRNIRYTNLKADLKAKNRGRNILKLNVLSLKGVEDLLMSNT